MANIKDLKIKFPNNNLNEIIKYSKKNYLF